MLLPSGELAQLSTMRAMGVLFDYFAAPTDADAAATIERTGGPAYATVADTGIDPVVQGGSSGTPTPTPG